jgi:hypothetical protein
VRQVLALVLLAFSVNAVAAGQLLSAPQAKSHVGENGTVCGEVASTHYAATTRGQPTFLNLDKSYPNQIFTALIWGGERTKIGTPEENFKNKRVCVSGKISLYRGVPEIVLYEPYQIRLQ